MIKKTNSFKNYLKNPLILRKMDIKQNPKKIMLKNHEQNIWIGPRIKIIKKKSWNSLYVI